MSSCRRGGIPPLRRTYAAVIESGNQPPAGTQVVKLSTSTALAEGARFRSYKLDAAGNPTSGSYTTTIVYQLN